MKVLTLRTIVSVYIPVFADGLLYDVVDLVVIVGQELVVRWGGR